MNILGISVCPGKSCACLLRDGQIVAIVHEKQDVRGNARFLFPVMVLEQCLQKAQVEFEELDLIVLGDKPYLQAQRLLGNALSSVPFGPGAFIQEVLPLFNQQLWITKLLFATPGFKGQVLFPGHHESLAGKVFFLSGFREAAFLLLAGDLDPVAVSCGQGVLTHLSFLAEQVYPNSLVLVYGAVKKFLGLKSTDDERFRELAAQGEPKYTELILSEWLDLKEDGSFHLNMDWFRCRTGPVLSVNKLDELLEKKKGQSGKFEAREMDLACSAQEAIGEVVLRMLRFLRKETGLQRLCLGGHELLNCVNIKRVAAKAGFREVYLQTGGSTSVGGVLFAWHQYLGKKSSVDIPMCLGGGQK